MKKVYKYGTGHPVPDKARYLATVVEERSPTASNTEGSGSAGGRFVWHYFLVEEADADQSAPHVA